MQPNVAVMLLEERRQTMLKKAAATRARRARRSRRRAERTRPDRSATSQVPANPMGCAV